MPSPIVETPSEGDAISAPVGADPRTAASVRTPFQAVGNRLKFLENFYDMIKVFRTGGVLTMLGDVIWNGFSLTVSKLTVGVGYLNGQSLRTLVVYHTGDNPVLPTVNPILHDTVLFKAGSIAADTTLKIFDDVDDVPIGYTVYVANGTTHVVNVNAYQGSGYSNVAVLSASGDKAAVIMKIETGPARWAQIIGGVGALSGAGGT